MNRMPRPQDLEPDAAHRPGMRIMAVEVLNWGTFDRRVWPLSLDGENALVTGDWRKAYDEVDTELKSLKSRRSSIPSHMLAIRERLCSALRLDPETVPFAGELIEVRKDAAAWEGAAERLVKPFALALLVPELHHAEVVRWVDATHLNGRLVHYKVPSAVPALRQRAPRDALATKLRVKDGTRFEPWLLREIDERFDHICCDDLDRLRREPKAITRAGQIKGKGERYDKDDRSAIDDRTRYVLGWSNEAKIRAVEAQATALAGQAQTLNRDKERLTAERKALRDRLDALKELSAFRSFNDLDWPAVVVEIERLEAERRQLAEGSDILKALNSQLGEAEQKLGEAREKLRKAQDSRATQIERKQRDTDLKSTATADLLTVAEDERETLFAKLDSVRAEVLDEHSLKVEACEAREREMRDRLGSLEQERVPLRRLDAM